MLAAIGVSSIEELFADIPEAMRMRGALDIAPGMAEQEVTDHLAALAARNRHADSEVTFAGAG
ncbi:MAG: glycine dehydrogenase, partial [Thermoleophilaceae bacterium]